VPKACTNFVDAQSIDDFLLASVDAQRVKSRAIAFCQCACTFDERFAKTALAAH
jgi:hypothetical protein